MDKFKRGDVVRIGGMPDYMMHFRGEAEAIVMNSYNSLYGGEDNDNYGVMFCDDGCEVSWYYGRQFTLLRHGGEEEIAAVKAARAAKDAIEGDLDWILANWKRIRTGDIPSATIGTLCGLVGLTFNDLWGSRGEGFVYQERAGMLLRFFDAALQTGDRAIVEERATQWQMQ